MYQIDNDTSSLNLPAPTAANRPGYFVDGDPAKGLAATILPAEFMNMLMMEFVNLVTAAGLAPSKSDYTQLSQAIPALISKLATVDWSKITNVPADLVHLNSQPTLSGIELNSSTPFIDFHFGGDASDYNFRIVNNVSGGIALANKAVGPILTVGPNNILATLPILSRSPFLICSQGANASLQFYSKDATKIEYFFQHDDTSLNLYTWPDSGSGVAALSITRGTGAIGFSSRPSFAGATPWDSANFNPSTKANAATTLSGYGITDAATKTDLSTKWDTGTYPPSQYIKLGQAIPHGSNIKFGSGGTPTIGSGVTDTGTAWFTNEGVSTAAAVVMFHREGAYAAYFGLDTDNQFKVGGYSMGASYLVWHGGNCDLVGSISYFAMNGPPAGFIKANGAAISRTNYAGLFAKIGTYYGAGDGSTTFNVPDLRGEFIRGFDDARGVDTNRVFGSWQAQDIQPHTHAIYASGSNTSYGRQGTGSGAGDYNALTASTGTTETRPRNVALLACIKY